MSGFPPGNSKPIPRARYLALSIAILLAQYAMRIALFRTQAVESLGSWTHIISAPYLIMGHWLTSNGWSLDSWVRFSPLLLILVDVTAACLLVALAIRRAKTTHRSQLFACMTLIPLIQIPTIIWLSTNEDHAFEDPPVVTVSIRDALSGLLAGGAISLAFELLSTLVFQTYGFGLFIASPVIIGVVTAYLGNRRGDIGAGATTRLVLGACFLGGIGLLAIAVEGIVCLALAAPLIAFMAYLGGLIGRKLAHRRSGIYSRRALMGFAVAPLAFGADLAIPPRYEFVSVQSVEVAANDRDVWDAVVHMGPINSPPPPPFRWGLAYPMSGAIYGNGVGAIRKGVFSTGIAYEKVTEWIPNRRLSFIVLSDPPAMSELSPYREVDSPHVRGYFRTLDARFTISPMENGHTSLTLTTRHELDLDPGIYWLPFAKWAVETNKSRVLTHFAQQAEVAAAQSHRPLG